jgi:ArsR family transcriptional regulator, lead/cadmium/zinc/bismuth-responsive transcriptional repressor
MLKRLIPENDPLCQPADHSERLLPALEPDALERAAGIFRAIGDVPRLRLLALLSQGPACVTELAAAEQENISTISQRLKILHAEKLVSRKRQGKHIQYRLADQHVVALLFNAMAHATEGPATPLAAIDGALLKAPNSPVTAPAPKTSPRRNQS